MKQPPPKNSIRVNDLIRSKTVRVILPNGEQLGVITLAEALVKARELQLDLIEIAGQSNPPVCKIGDFGKYKFDLSKKQKQLKKNNVSVDNKTVAFTMNIGENDLLRKVSDIKKFLDRGDNVTAQVVIKGLENKHPELAFKLMEKIVKEVGIPPCEKPSKQSAGGGNKVIALFKPTEKE